MELQDKLKLGLAGLLVLAGIAGFYLVPDTQPFLSGVVFVVGLVLAVGVIWLSQPGKSLVQYAQESVVEAKKVVWPNRRETMQLTGLVFLFVFVLALFMWGVDSGLSWVFYDVLLGRG